MTIRPARPSDAAPLVALRRTVFPYLVRGEAATRRTLVTPPPGSSMASFVALSGSGAVVGFAAAFKNTSTTSRYAGQISLLHVHPAFRGRGHGSALLAASISHLRSLGLRDLRGYALPSSLPFAAARGFTASREVRYSGLGLSAPLPPAPALPAGYTLAPVSAISDRALFAAEAAGVADEPGDVAPDALTFEGWRYDVWEDPGLDKEASFVVLSPAGEVASLSLLQRDGDRCWSDMTATLPGHRGRGLARLAKTAALTRAAATGATMAYTSNDASNGPMLAINTRLGYRPAASTWSALITLPA
ncbi:GNAT superfamily N-acetyltransferase [Catenuloplanes nepalensis]|uniref:GNAT superfamily N-acetyltransferase n=1 Tax=Catenuloplanes nepalensis TaxID=587533 RepID=A0ABT9N6F4_9ACTN|nr:GNAT family N-acetyltransferase [Catenuloplanes nepalensis]MDP9799264.1 GNAT superfamily N-acetyltransferase [Catenuloplanes nepalensis]